MSLFLAIFYTKKFKIKFKSYEIILLTFLVYIFIQTLYLKILRFYKGFVYFYFFLYIFFIKVFES